MTTPAQPQPAAPGPNLEFVARKLTTLEQLLRDLPDAVAHKVHFSGRAVLTEDAGAGEGPITSPASTETDAVQAEWTDIQGELAKAHQELEEKIKELSAQETQLAATQAARAETEAASTALKNDIAATRELLSGLQGELTAAQEDLEKIRLERAVAEQMIGQAETARQEIEAVEGAKLETDRRAAEAAQKEDALRALEAEYSGYREGHETAQRLLARIWPHWLASEGFAPWRLQLEKGIFATDTPASAALLFAALHGYNAALREAGDPRFLLDSLRELSRRLLAWLKELGYGEAEAATHAQEWAAEVNRECAGKAEVEVPVPGNPADTSWMIFPPRTGSTEIVAVHSWCVRDGQKRPINKAQVTV